MKSQFDNIKFLAKERGRSFFKGYSMIKAELKELPCEVDKAFIKFYDTGFKDDYIFHDKIYQLDIKSCYPNILLNDDLITYETFQYLSSLKKEDRLAAIGMLASRRNVYEIDENGVYIHYRKESEYSDYFFYCIQATYKIMNDCKEELGENFLFSWVDAIYFKGGKRQALKIQNFLVYYHNLNSTFSELLQFEVQLKGNNYKLAYTKNGINTFMRIPIHTNQELAELKNIILQLNLKYENNQTKNNTTKRTEGRGITL